jgi:hypothetical protein
VRLLWEWVVEKQEDITVVTTKEKVERRVERRVENNVIEEPDENKKSKSNQNQIKIKFLYNK